MARLKNTIRQAANLCFRLLTYRIYAVIVLMGCLCAVMVYVTGNLRPVYISDGDFITLRYTFADKPEEILDDFGITLMAFDVLDFNGFAGKVGEINITRAYPVYLTCDGVTRKFLTAGRTLRELLAQAGIKLGPYDELSHHPDYELAPNDRILLRRVQLTTETVQTVLPFETERRYSSLLRTGYSRVLTPGYTGVMETTITVRIVDGVVVSEQLVEENVLRRPVNQVVLVGSTGTPVSKLDFGVPLDAHGKPTQYQELLTDQIATGYNAGRGAWGASGMTLSAGYVAVRADQIPYGTRLYITTEDGSFVYGYAIAADTGIGLMENIIDVDLYYDTYMESRLNGRRNVQIYILG